MPRLKFYFLRESATFLHFFAETITKQAGAELGQAQSQLRLEVRIGG